MKRSVFIGAILLVTGTAVFAQKGEINNAKTAYTQYDGLRSANAKLAGASLDKAKLAIDKAVANEKTISDPEAWGYKALIYATLADRDSSDAAFANIPTALEAKKKALELDTKGVAKTIIASTDETLYRVFINRAVKQYQGAKYDDSYGTFEQAAAVAGEGKDTIANYYAAISAQNSAARQRDENLKKQGFQKAVAKYNLLLPTKFSYLEDVYSNLSILYAASGDTATAIKTAGDGVKRFPKSSTLATREIEYSLMTHKEKETIAKIQDQAAKEPTNKLLPFYLGIAYNALKDYKSAEESYKKAVEIDPNYADALTNLGVLIMNNGVYLYKEASNLPANKTAEYNAGVKKANVEFDRSLPYLLKAIELDPKSDIALKSLKAYYDIKNDKVKSDEIKKKLAEL